MKKKRIIARLDVKGPNVIKGVRLECLRVVGKPNELAQKYYNQGADELIYMDIVASLYGRQNILDIVNQTSENIFIPLTVGGGVRTLDDIRCLLKAGADKVAVNTAATKNPDFITEAARTFGSQCIVVSIEAKRVAEGKWEAFTDNSREKTGLNVIEWAKKAEQLGAGEILLTSIDREGTKEGFDLELVKKVCDSVRIPVIASGGAGSYGHITDCAKENVDGIAVASMLHYNLSTIEGIKNHLENNGVAVRKKQIVEIREHKNRLEDATMGWDVGIIDYGINNLKSVSKAFGQIGKTVKIIDTPEDVLKSKSLVIPGIGAYEDGMKGLENKSLIKPIKKKVNNGAPILGICLGMQLLFSESEEFGLHKGLNLIEGKVVSLKSPSEILDKEYRVPHTGWDEIFIPTFSKDKKIWQGTLLGNFPEKSDVYFVHSFFPLVKNPEEVVATAVYGGQEFCTVVKKDNICGTQFHPEKSGELGLAMLKNFCDINEI